MIFGSKSKIFLFLCAVILILQFKQDIDDNIIAFIRMTILAEAYRSLGGQRFRKAALNSFGPLTGKHLTALTPWRNYLLNNTAYPGLNYRY
jgi:hypothetical protein